MTAATLWAHVQTTKSSTELLQLTNAFDRAATTVNAVVGVEACQSILDYWPAYAQVAFDETDALHLEVATEWVIAQLWKRGGTNNRVAREKWDAVVGRGGELEKLVRTGPRARQAPKSNSGTSTSSELLNGRRRLGWSDPRSIARGILPDPLSDRSYD